MGIIEFFRTIENTGNLHPFAVIKYRHIRDGELPFVSPYAYSVRSRRIAEDAQPGDDAFAFSQERQAIIASGFVVASGRPVLAAEFKHLTTEGRAGVIYVAWTHRPSAPIPLAHLLDRLGMTHPQFVGYVRNGLVPVPALTTLE